MLNVELNISSYQWVEWKFLITIPRQVIPIDKDSFSTTYSKVHRFWKKRWTLEFVDEKLLLSIENFGNKWKTMEQVVEKIAFLINYAAP